jgi:toxin ParE1/3/4
LSRPQPALTPAAHADVLQAAQHYNAQASLLGFEFLDEFEETTSLIHVAPLLFTLVDPPIRRALVHRFPYGVFYVPGSDTEPDVVVAVVDLRQDPEVIRQAYRR